MRFWPGLNAILLLGAGLVQSGCVERAAPTVAFSAEEAAFIRKPGKTILTGHAFRTRSLGQVVNAAGQVVRLVPDTAFSRERFTQLYGKGRFIAHSAYPREDKVDPLYGDYTRTTKAESNGRFVFRDVAPGAYFVTTQVIWGEDDALFKQGGSVYDNVTITGRETEPVHVILSGN